MPKKSSHSKSFPKLLIPGFFVFVTSLALLMGILWLKDQDQTTNPESQAYDTNYPLITEGGPCNVTKSQCGISTTQRDSDYNGQQFIYTWSCITDASGQSTWHKKLMCATQIEGEAPVNAHCSNTTAGAKCDVCAVTSPKIVKTLCGQIGNRSWDCCPSQTCVHDVQTNEGSQSICYANDSRCLNQIITKTTVTPMGCTDDLRAAYECRYGNYQKVSCNNGCNPTTKKCRTAAQISPTIRPSRTPTPRFQPN